MKRKEENMTKKYNEIPYFQNEEEEREFWAKHNSTDYLDWDKTNISYFPKLKPTKKKSKPHARTTRGRHKATNNQKKEFITNTGINA